MPTVLIVDDSAVVRVVFRQRWADRGWRPVVARDGAEAVRTVSTLTPDLITLDLRMPGMDGAQTAAALRARGYAGPLVLLSGASGPDARATLEALAAGADDFVPKPSGIDDTAATVAEMIERYAALVGRAPTPPEAPAAARADGLSLVCVAASTGGPRALVRLLTGLERGVPLVVVQHMPPRFTRAFADSLAEASGLRVAEVPPDGREVRLDASDVWVAPGGRHLRLGRERAWAEDGERLHGVMPAADVTIADAADAFGRRLGVAILTGMGSDGAEGARRAHARGAVVVAESPESATVFGMPQAALAAGAVDAVWPLERIRAWLGDVQHSARAAAATGDAP
jgi:two-component system chemotaxis response regulator CheB